MKIKILSSFILGSVQPARDPGVWQLGRHRTEVQTGVASEWYQVNEAFRQGALSQECVGKAVRRSKLLS